MSNQDIRFRYFTLYRPPMLGAIPSGAIEVFSYDDRHYIEDVQHDAWGYAVYDHPLTEAQISDYELAPDPTNPGEQNDDGVMETVYTVTIRENGSYDFTPWVSTFSSREAAEAFAAKAEEKLKQYGAEDEMQITLDSGEMDSELYLDFIDARYESYDKEE